MNCLLYARVSTDKQAEKELSIPAQLQACRQFAQQRSWSILEEFVEAGVSGRTADRPILRRLLTRCRDREAAKVDVVLVHKLDRFARSLADHIAIRASLQKQQIRLVSVTENIEESTAGQLVENIMASMAEFYSANLSDEVRKGLRQKVLQGGWPHQPPRGYRIERVDGRSRVTIHHDQGPIVRRAFELCLLGYTGLLDLRQRLAHIGLVTRSQRPLSNGPLVRLLTNPFYTGRLRWKDVVAVGNQPPLVPPAMFDKVQEVLRSRSRIVTRGAGRHLLSGLARCSSCGELVGAEQHDKWLYYRCRGAARAVNRCRARFCPGRRAHAALEDIYRRLVPSSVFKHQVIRQLTDDNSTTLADHERSRQGLRIELGALMGRETRLASMFADGLLVTDAYELAQRRIAEERIELMKRLEAIGDRDVRALTKAAAYLERATSMWEIHIALPLDQQRRLVVMIFTDLRLSATGISDYRLDPSLTERAA